MLFVLQDAEQVYYIKCFIFSKWSNEALGNNIFLSETKMCKGFEIRYLVCHNARMLFHSTVIYSNSSLSG